MFERLYIHNFRCLENFELALAGKPSALLIGKNGSGKSTVRLALEVLQKIARGTSRVGQLLTPGDLGRNHANAPLRLEVDVRLDGRLYQYRLAFEHPARAKELRVLSEQLLADGAPVYTRELARVALKKGDDESAFTVDWHLIALPIIQEQSESDPLFVFKRWLAHSVILAPIPGLISGESSGETLELDRSASNLGAWLAGILAHSPAAYATIDGFMKGVMPDFVDVKNPIAGGDRRSLQVQFRADAASLSLKFSELSDGEKCIFICALVVAANAAYGPLFCFWDEPDSHLSISEVGHFTMALRRAFTSGGQILMTSHSPEAIRRFSDENTLLLFRRSHLEPTRVRLINDIAQRDDLIDAMIRDDLDP
jgi:predicted ATPase